LTEPIEQHAGEIYLIKGPERLTFAEIAERFSRVLGREVRHVSVPDGAYKETMMHQGDMPGWQAQGVLELEVRCRQGEFSAVTDAVERVGKQRPTTFEDFISRHAASLAV
jgi:NAD(P)H dehydrogenase (quinone)